MRSDQLPKNHVKVEFMVCVMSLLQTLLSSSREGGIVNIIFQNIIFHSIFNPLFSSLIFSYIYFYLIAYFILFSLFPGNLWCV